MWILAHGWQEELSAEKRKLTEYFESGPGSQSPPTSLYFQALGRRYVYIATRVVIHVYMYLHTL